MEKHQCPYALIPCEFGCGNSYQAKERDIHRCIPSMKAKISQMESVNAQLKSSYKQIRDSQLIPLKRQYEMNLKESADVQRVLEQERARCQAQKAKHLPQGSQIDHQDQPRQMNPEEAAVAIQQVLYIDDDVEEVQKEQRQDVQRQEANPIIQPRYPPPPPPPVRPSLLQPPPVSLTPMPQPYVRPGPPTWTCQYCFANNTTNSCQNCQYQVKNDVCTGCTSESTFCYLTCMH